MKYTANDIILRAQQYANMENTKFFSYAELTGMLNEAWQTLYQYLCNTGDKYWIKTVKFNGSLTLPDDLYQIAAVYDDKDQIFNFSSKNNTLTVDHPNGKLYTLEYYPIPLTLTFKKDIEKSVFQCGSDGDVYCIRDELYLKKATGADGVITLTLNNIKDHKSVELPSLTGALFNIYNNGILSDTSKLYDFKSLTVKDIDGKPVIYNDTVFSYKDGVIKDLDGNEVMSVTLPDAASYYTEDWVTFINTHSLPWKGVSISGNNVISANGTLVYTKYKPIGYCNNSILTKDVFGTLYTESMFNDTIINYPNNIYVTIIALDIAMKMRAKQNNDNQLLNMQYIEAKNTLFNTITRNKGNHTIIKDVYDKQLYN